MTSKERQTQTDKVRELNKSSAEKEQPAEETLLKENFVETQV